MVRDGAFDAEFAEPAIARFTCTSRQISRSERIAKTYPTTSIRIISSGSIDGRPYCEARKDREQHRSSAPDDLPEPRRQDETRRTVDLGHSSDGPSSIDLAENRVNTTESRFAASLNRLLQQNRHFSDMPGQADDVRF